MENKILKEIITKNFQINQNLWPLNSRSEKEKKKKLGTPYLIAEIQIQIKNLKTKKTKKQTNKTVKECIRDSKTMAQRLAYFSPETLKVRKQKNKLCKVLNEMKQENKSKTQQLPKIL